jgi:thiamine-monophosphate kinase
MVRPTPPGGSPESVAVNDEDQLLRWLRRRLDRPLIGDDAAILPAGGPFAITVDSQVAGVHFIPGLDPAYVAQRLLAVNLSDLAAMGAVPKYGFLALTAPRGFDHRRFFRALLAACARHRLRLAGGDLARSPDAGFVATLTLAGGKRRRARWLHRGGAAPGHCLWLGGTAGESAAGRLLIGAGARMVRGRVTLPAAWTAASGRPALAVAARLAVRRHLMPEPQLNLGWWLARQTAGAAIDVSDGIARDLSRLCRESRVGARLEGEHLPLARSFPALCATLGVEAIDLAINGGEDYVLLFTLPAGIEVPARFGCARIGVITSRRRISIASGVAGGAGGAAWRDLPPGGWDHLAGG